MVGKDLTFVLVVLVTILVGAWIAVARPNPFVSGLNPKVFWSQKLFAESVYDVVVAGDSRIYRGISPSEMSKRLTGKAILNFGFSSAPLNKVFMESSAQKLRPGTRTNVLVFGVTPYSLTERAAVENGFDSLMKEYGGKKVVDDSGSLAMKVEDLLERFRPFLFLEISTIVSGKQVSGHFQHYSAEGWIASELVPPNPRMTLADYRKNFAGNTVGKENLDEFAVEVRDLVARGIRVFGFRPPVGLELLALEEQMSGYREPEVVRILEEAGGKWLAIENKGYETSDGSHLDIRSATLLSGRLADAIHAELDRQ